MSTSPPDPIFTDEQKVLAFAVALGLAALAAGILTHPRTGGGIMRALILLAAAAAALLIAGCATPGFTPAELAKAANELDPGCYKHLEVTATPVMLFGFAVPIVSGRYEKTCNPDQAARPAVAPAVAVGALVR